MKKATGFAAGFAMAFVLAAVSDGAAEVHRYSAFNCYGDQTLGYKSGVPDAAAGIWSDNLQMVKAYCPVTSSSSFPLSNVEHVYLQFFTYESYSGILPYTPSAKACVSWSYTSGGTSFYSVVCDDEIPIDHTVVGGNELILSDGLGDLDAWHNHPAGFPYLVVNSGGVSIQQLSSATFTGYKVSDT